MTFQLSLTAISAGTKGKVKRLRIDGFIPVTIQHKGMAPMHFQQESAPLDAFIKRHGDAALLDLATPPDGECHRVIVHDVNRNAVTKRLEQVTFQQIRHDDTLHTHVPLVLSGEPEAARLGGAILQHQLDRVQISCDQHSLPEQIVVDVSHLEIGDVVRVSDVPVHARFKIVTPPDTVLASLTSTRAAISVEDAASEAAQLAATP